MIEVEVRLREWGGSLGAVMPKDAVEQERLKSGDMIKILVLKKTNALRETFGVMKLRKSTDEILREIDEDGWRE